MSLTCACMWSAASQTGREVLWTNGLRLYPRLCWMENSDTHEGSVWRWEASLWAFTSRHTHVSIHTFWKGLTPTLFALRRESWLCYDGLKNNKASRLAVLVFVRFFTSILCQLITLDLCNSLMHQTSKLCSCVPLFVKFSVVPALYQAACTNQCTVRVRHTPQHRDSTS